MDRNGRYTYCGPQSNNILGYEPQEIVGKSPRDLMPEKDAEKLLAIFNDLTIEHKTVDKLEHTILHKEGTEVIFETSGIPFFSATEKFLGYRGIARDITERQNREADLWHLAHFDSLTGLPNRAMLSDRMKIAIAQSKRNGKLIAVCLMDLDGFKQVNDTLGHKAGDILLKEVSYRLLQTMREEDTVIRLGGDEFVIILNGLENVRQGEQVIKRILYLIAQPFKINKNTAQVTASIGVTLFPKDNADTDLLLRHADQAMYRAKKEGKNDYFLFDTTLEAKHLANKMAIQQIKKALLKGQLEFYYQPQVDCYKGEVIGAEALIRWNHPILGLRAPSEFLPLIEKDEFMIQLSQWTIETALNQLQEWQSRGIDIRLGVNISSRFILHGGLHKCLDEMLKKYTPNLLSKLEIELLETTALDDLKVVGKLIREYQKKDIAFALDDFGTGYSSLSHLKHLSVNTLKIDQSFIRDMLADPGDMAIVQGVLGLSDAFKMGVVAEGAETIDHVMRLLEMGCHVIQGYGIARPMQTRKFYKWYKEFKENPLWDEAREKYPSRDYFEILLMEVKHKHWVDHLNDIFIDQSLDTNPEISATTYENCHVTDWYQNKGLELYGSVPEFYELDILHRKVHDIGHRFLDSIKNKQIEQSNTLFSELSVISDKFLLALHRIRIIHSNQNINN